MSLEEEKDQGSYRDTGAASINQPGHRNGDSEPYMGRSFEEEWRVIGVFARTSAIESNNVCR